jgi:hypothetical protein
MGRLILTRQTTGRCLRFVQCDFLQRSQFSQSDELDLALRVYQFLFACERNLPIDAGSVMNLELQREQPCVDRAGPNRSTHVGQCSVGLTVRRERRGLRRVQLPPGNWFVPPGDNRNGGGGNEAVGPFYWKGSLSDSAASLSPISLLTSC